MTEEELFKANTGLIWWSIIHYKYLCPWVEEEDLYQILSIELLKAIRDFDPSKGKLSTLAAKYMFHRCINVRNEEERAKRKANHLTESYDKIIDDMPEGKASHRQMRVVLDPKSIELDENDVNDNIRDIRIELDKHWHKMPARHQLVTIHWMEGLGLEESAARLGVTRERVRQLRLKVIDFYKDCFA